MAAVKQVPPISHGTLGELLDLRVSVSASANWEYSHLLHKEGGDWSSETRPAILNFLLLKEELLEPSPLALNIVILNKHLLIIW